MIRAVVFDMDGVLIDAKDWHYEALNRALGLFGFGISRYDHLTVFDGLPTRRKLQMLSAASGLPAELHGFISDIKQRYTMEIVHGRCKPRFNHEYALSRLRQRGYRLAVASNSIRCTIETMMRLAALDHHFEFVLSNEDVAEAKPDPEIYRLAIARLGIAASECLVVEDHDNGIRAARAAGAHVLAVDGVDDVTEQAILARIASCDATAASVSAA